MTVATCTPERPVRKRGASLTTARLLDTPLPQLLGELGVELHESSITDAGFYGAVVVLRDGQMVLSMPGGRSAFQRDTVARMLLAEALGIETAPIPEPLRMKVVA